MRLVFFPPRSEIWNQRDSSRGPECHYYSRSSHFLTRWFKETNALLTPMTSPMLYWASDSAVLNTPRLHATHCPVCVPSHHCHTRFTELYSSASFTHSPCHFPSGSPTLFSPQYPLIFSLSRPWYVLFITEAGVCVTCAERHMQRQGNLSDWRKCECTCSALEVYL